MKIKTVSGFVAPFEGGHQRHGDDPSGGECCCTQSIGLSLSARDANDAGVDDRKDGNDMVVEGRDNLAWDERGKIALTWACG